MTCPHDEGELTSAGPRYYARIRRAVLRELQGGSDDPTSNGLDAVVTVCLAVLSAAVVMMLTVGAGLWVCAQ